ncbi:BtrH N-terminal domain-containing protein [Kibdelosporangium philippinense]|uniref:BtrH N-terminal domain-containing protein n=2 Tax=Kibdelosporangium philippinense TaxID=211113 RepID=A0ABS8ZJ22_9PSEU|nr:DUF4872 domain-containing protein [Kibdelosporangium philippinense]MCE7007808.1 BtrH N-terminal domain-containing protein [Kibdelosporangium philippinense]
MTDHKKLKRLVRDRMAATGESYTTARWHITSKTKPQHRVSKLLATALDDEYSEAMITGLAGGIGFMYAVFEYKGMHPLMTIMAQHHPDPWVPAVLNRLNVSFVEQHSGKAEAGIAKLRKATRPVFAEVDRSALPWHEPSPWAGYDPYTVLVVEISETVSLIDVDRHELSIEDFSKAWSAYRKGKHHAIVMGTAGKPDLDKAVSDAIQTTVDHMTGPVLGNNFDVNFGFSGMSKLADQLRDTRTKAGWTKRFGDTDHGTKRLYECLEEQNTAPGATRPLYADFLDEVGRAEAAKLFKQSGAAWSRLAKKAKMSKDYPAMAEIVDECLDLESRAVELLRQPR